MKIPLKHIFVGLLILPFASLADVSISVAALSTQEKQEILASEKPYVYFGDTSLVGITTQASLSFKELVTRITKISTAKEMAAPLNDIISRIAAGLSVAPEENVLAALNNLHECLIRHNELIVDDKELRALDTAITTYRKLFSDGSLTIVSKSPTTKPQPNISTAKPKESPAKPVATDSTIQTMKNIIAQMEALVASLEMRAK